MNHIIREKINQSKHKNYILFSIGTFLAFLAFYILTYIALPFITFGTYKYPDIDENAIPNIIFNDILPLFILFCSLYGEIQIYKKKETWDVKPFLYFLFAGLLFLLFVIAECIIGIFAYPLNKDLRRAFVFIISIPISIIAIFFMIKNGIKAMDYSKRKKTMDSEKAEPMKNPIPIQIQIQSDKEAKDSVKVVVKTDKSEMTIDSDEL